MQKSKAKKARRIPDCKDWLVDSESCTSSLSFFEGHRAIMILDRRVAEDNLKGHLKKAHHNLDLATSSRTGLCTLTPLLASDEFSSMSLKRL